MNNKGYTLVELLATMVILGILMAVTIPNISGISTQNKITKYAEDAKKFKNTAEYMFRGDDTVVKPVNNKECLIVNLRYVHGNEYDDPPYGGSYDMDNSVVVMVKSNRRYEYYVQLVEKFTADGVDNYRGFSLLKYSELESDTYLDKLSEGVNLTPFVNITNWGSESSILGARRTSPSSKTLKNIAVCDDIIGIYHSA